MQLPKYNFSFTAASALISETIVVAEEYLRCSDWKVTEQNLLSFNLLQKEKQVTAKRQIKEIRLRLQTLTRGQILVLTSGSLSDAKAMVWLSIIKTYAYIYDFTIEVLFSKYHAFDYILSDGDYLRFYNAKHAVHLEMLKQSDRTNKKIKQVIYLMSEQCGLIENFGERRIVKPFITTNAERAILEENPALLSFFLYNQSEIKNIHTA